MIFNYVYGLLPAKACLSKWNHGNVRLYGVLILNDFASLRRVSLLMGPWSIGRAQLY